MDTLVVIGEGFDLAVEKARIDDALGWVESQVKDLRANRNDWHSSDVVNVERETPRGRLGARLYTVTPQPQPSTVSVSSPLVVVGMR